MMAPEDVLLETIGAILHYGDQPWIRKQMCQKLREAIRVENIYLPDPAALPIIRDDAEA